jgi:hypothetical protein
MSKYIFYAKVNKAFINPFKVELKQLGLEPENLRDLNQKGLNYLKFQSDFKPIWKIMLYSRLIEELKIQISDKISA